MMLAGAARWARRNWISCILLIAIGAALLWGPKRTEAPADAEAPPDSGAGQTAPAPRAEDAREAEQQALKDAMQDAIYRQLVLERNRLTAKSEITEHLEELEETPEPYELAARLCALGNLYQQEADFEKAAGYYELVIDDYPDWPGIQSVYHQLIACYKRMDAQQSLRLLYRDMMEAFPEGSPEHEFAKANLAP